MASLLRSLKWCSIREWNRNPSRESDRRGFFDFRESKYGESSSSLTRASRVPKSGIGYESITFHIPPSVISGLDCHVESFRTRSRIWVKNSRVDFSSATLDPSVDQ